MKTKEKSLIPSAAESSVLQRRHDSADDDTHRFAPTLLGLFSESRTQGTLQEGQQHRRQVVKMNGLNAALAVVHPHLLQAADEFFGILQRVHYQRYGVHHIHGVHLETAIVFQLVHWNFGESFEFALIFRMRLEICQKESHSGAFQVLANKTPDMADVLFFPLAQSSGWIDLIER